MQKPTNTWDSAMMSNYWPSDQTPRQSCSGSSSAWLQPYVQPPSSCPLQQPSSDHNSSSSSNSETLPPSTTASSCFDYVCSCSPRCPDSDVAAAAVAAALANCSDSYSLSNEPPQHWLTMKHHQSVENFAQSANSCRPP